MNRRERIDTVYAVGFIIIAILGIVCYLKWAIV